MMKDIPNRFYHYPDRTFYVWEGIKTQEYKRTPTCMSGCRTTMPLPPTFCSNWKNRPRLDAGIP
jgi:hypothetical protein